MRALVGFCVASLVFSGLAIMRSSSAEARTMAECQLAWAQAVRSYLTKNQRAAPDGSVPTNMDETEAAAERWNQAFRPACELEAGGDKTSARIEAAALGAKILARLDLRGCGRFLEYYMESTRPQEVCRAAGRGDDDDLRQQIERTIPAR